MRCFIIAILSAILGVVGCSQKTAIDSAAGGASSNVAASGQAAATHAAPQPITVPASASPDQVVTVFLNALRSGDSPTTESLLTGKARQELAQHSLSVDVQPAQSA